MKRYATRLVIFLAFANSLERRPQCFVFALQDFQLLFLVVGFSRLLCAQAATPFCLALAGFSIVTRTAEAIHWHFGAALLCDAMRICTAA